MKSITVIIKFILKGGQMCATMFIDSSKIIKSFYNIVMRGLGG